jgi:beta-ribofuranosylaminobenzene 5'-phosphate synthase
MTPNQDSYSADCPTQLALSAVGRVHFGLWEISESAPNCFGGIGLMIQHSDLVLHAGLGSSINSASVEIEADDYWRPRIQSVVDRWSLSSNELPISWLQVEKSPPPHRGLGSGTQMACAIATLLQLGPDALTNLPRNLSDPHVPITALFRQPGKPTQDSAAVVVCMSLLAKIGQRGNRSNIGLHGFLAGGFIIDQGMRLDGTGDQLLPPRTSRIAFPQWPIIVVRNENAQGDSGQSEKEMFNRCSHAPNPNRMEMMSLVEFEIGPAIANNDWERFDVAIGQYGRLAGQIFAPAQGGVYRTEQIAHTIETVKQLGIAGATQTSWGPTVVAIAKDFEQADWCRKRLHERLPHLAVEIVHAANHSAQAWVP